MEVDELEGNDYVPVSNYIFFFHSFSLFSQAPWALTVSFQVQEGSQASCRVVEVQG